MKAIFAGYGRLGLVCLDAALQSGMQIEYVLTHNDGDFDSVDRFCSDRGIIHSFSDPRNDARLLEALVARQVRFLLSVNYRYIIPYSLLESVEHPLNIHGSLLPKYRGRTPHVWAIINGERKTGVTCHVMEPGVDTGGIYHQREVAISDEDTGYTLLRKFEQHYPECLLATLKKIDSGFVPVPQDHAIATYFGRRIPEMGYIDLTKDACSVMNFIRAQASPYPGAYYYLSDGQRITVNLARVERSISVDALDTGVIYKDEDGYFARCKDSCIRFLDYSIG